MRLFDVLVETPIFCDSLCKDFCGEASSLFFTSYTVASGIFGWPPLWTSNNVPRTGCPEAKGVRKPQPLTFYQLHRVMGGNLTNDTCPRIQTLLVDAFTWILQFVSRLSPPYCLIQGFVKNRPASFEPYPSSSGDVGVGNRKREPPWWE
ncbi:unnamed protein product [Darwinula stevensoni]|uniref:Uncharacterized protein n=1 Tax=Darwinula stevensoni TaxID=69355 RepID=A0A7R9A8R7_9CRUS|nr:unnamed protein product [Darwinula stevensoni]CAG0896662.1 unnamed protein product [Darwinula stevensoni]